MSTVRTTRSAILAPIFATSLVLGVALAACGGDTIGDSTNLFLDGGETSTDATIPDSGVPETSVVTQMDAGDSSASCASGQDLCGLVCVDETSDGNNCGACGHACSGGTVCNAGICALSCNGGTTACGNSCVNELNDVNNCGGCGVECASGLVCSAGHCGVSCAAGLTRCVEAIPTGDGGVDAGGATDAGDAGDASSDAGPSGPSVCVDALEDRNNCGGCGIQCSAGQVCSAGSCQATCQPGLVQCGGNCVDPLTNKNFCGVTTGCNVGIELADGGVDAGGAAVGTFGVACGIGQVCSSGTCQLTCAANQVSCGGECIDPSTNANFCGAAGNCTNVGTGNKAGSICPSGEICNGSGVCAITCQAGQVQCGSTCVDPKSNGDFCGATKGCGMGTGSAGTTCAGGTVCTTNNAGVGTCQTMCAQGQSLCNGVCVDPNTNEFFCGASADCSNKGTDCSKTPGTVCGGAANGCTTTCQVGEVLCGGKCIDPSTNETYCGARGDCVTSPNDNVNSIGTTCSSATGTGNQVCNGGSCAPSCATGFVLCKGACVDPTTDDSFCGAHGACSDMTAMPGTGDSSGVDCGSGANTGTTCVNSACVANCGTGLTVCSNACVDVQVDPKHCGSCGNACVANNNSPDCITSTTNGATTTACAIGVCNAGFADCANGETDGCEVDTLTDPSNCGGCGTMCTAGQFCSGGSCSPASCAAILAANPASKDGVYTLQPVGSPSFQAYCDMTTNGGGWTLVMKLTSDATLGFGSAYWATGALLNETDLTVTTGTNSVYPSYATVAGSQIRGILDGYVLLYNLTATHPSSLDIFNNEINDTVDPWPASESTDMNPNFALQQYCHTYGINIELGSARARLGWSGNENAPNDCTSNDSVDGFGTQYNGTDRWSAGYFDIDDAPHADVNAGGNGTLWIK